MALYLGKRKITPIKVVDLEDDLDTELTEQEENLKSLGVEVDALKDISDETLDITENGKYDVVDYGKVNVKVTGSKGEYFVKVIDYDGTILAEANLNTGDTFELPTPPTHDGLVFQEWSCSQEIVDNTITIEDNDVMVGAVYTTESGLNEFDIELTESTGLLATLNMSGIKDWGDGTSDDLTKHTYSDYGKYTIKCDGNSFSTTSSKGAFGQYNNANSYNYYCTNIRLANIQYGMTGAFQHCKKLKTVILSKNVWHVSSDLFPNCPALKALIVPSRVTKIDARALTNCYSLANVVIPLSIKELSVNAFSKCSVLKDVVIPKNANTWSSNVFTDCTALTKVKIPDTAKVNDGNIFSGCKLLSEVNISNATTKIGLYAFSGCPITKIDITEGVTLIDGYAFSNCSMLKEIKIPKLVASIGKYAFQYCASLEKVELEEGITTINNQAFYCCYNLKDLKLPSSITTIGDNAFGGCYSLEKIVVPSGVSNIGSYVFSSCYVLTEYDFSTHTAVPTLANTNAFTGINAFAKIIVPDNLYDEWIASTNWVTYADYIYKASEVSND